VITVDIRTATDGDDAGGVRDLIVTAINDNSPFVANAGVSVTASADPAPSVPNALVHIVGTPGSAGNVTITDTVATAFFGTVVGMDGGLDEDERGGWSSPARGERALEGAGEMLEVMITKSSLRVDLPAFVAVQDRLDRQMRVSCYIDEFITPLEWIRAHLLEALPDLRLVMGPEGVRPTLWDRRKLAERIGTILDVDSLNIERDGPVEYTSPDDVVNSVSLSYAHRADTGAYGETATVSGASGQDSNSACRRSAARFGERRLTIESDVIVDATSAGLVAAQLATVNSQPRVRVTYQADPSVVVHLGLGDPVAVTDSELYWSEKAFQVVGITDDGGPTIGLALESIEVEG
jgi:hypothetical protein